MARAPPLGQEGRVDEAVDCKRSSSEAGKEEKEGADEVRGGEEEAERPRSESCTEPGCAQGLELTDSDSSTVVLLQLRLILVIFTFSSIINLVSFGTC